jgi:hypothetical protein
LLLAFGNNASVTEATGLEGHERGGRRVFDWEDQFEVYRGFHGSETLIRPFLSLRTDWGGRAEMSPAGSSCHLYFGVMSRARSVRFVLAERGVAVGKALGTLMTTAHAPWLRGSLSLVRSSWGFFVFEVL